LVLELKATFTRKHCKEVQRVRRAKKLMSLDKTMIEKMMKRMIKKKKKMIKKVNMKMKTGKI